MVACASMRKLLVASAAVVFACGGPDSKTPVTPVTTVADAGADVVLPTHVISTLPTDVRNPPPFNLGSKHASKRTKSEWGACHASFHTSVQDPLKATDALANACASATKLKMSTPPSAMSGTQNAISSQPIVYKFHGQAKHCYRVYGVAGANVKSLVAVVADSEGAEIAEYHTDEVTPFIAPDEALCFSDDSDGQITVSVGMGDGPYALSLWSD